MSETAERKGKSGSEKRQRTAQHRIRLLPSEAEALNTHAAAAGMPVAAYVRHRVLGTPGPRSRVLVTPDRAALARLRGDLGYVGNNLNQIARVLNVEGGEGLANERRDIDGALARLNELIGFLDDAVRGKA